MQTFLPSPNYRESASVLDPSRLGNQFYREGLTLLRGKWPNHPAAKMWRGCFYSLCDYLLACYDELKSRGRDYPHHREEVLLRQGMHRYHTEPPYWLGDDNFHSAHRSNLLRKSEYYQQFGWSEPDTLEYVWPVMPQFFYQPWDELYNKDMKHACLVCTQCPKCEQYIGMKFTHGKKYMEKRLEDQNIWFFSDEQIKFLRTGVCTGCQN